jgi:AcrR family transcriptional regulator
MISDSPLLDEILRAREPDEIGTRILDAALQEYLSHGLRRTSMDDVARKANLGRATIYRRFASRDELVQAVLLRECRRFFAEIAAAVDGLPTVAQRLVEGFVVGVRNARTHPLLTRMLSLEPDVSLPLLTIEGGPVLTVLRDFLVQQYLASPEALESDINPVEVAEILVRLSISLTLTPDTSLPLSTDEETRKTARRYLIPLLTGPTARSDQTKP